MKKQEPKIRRLNVDEWAAFQANPDKRMQLILQMRKQGYDEAQYNNKTIWSREWKIQ